MLGPALCSVGAVRLSLQMIRNRTDFLLAAAAKRQGSESFLLQARDRCDGDSMIRVGFTASKKIGNAVMRNRAKRRLRAAARVCLAQHGVTGWDYVLVARPKGTATRPFALLLNDMEAALEKIHRVSG